MLGTPSIPKPLFYLAKACLLGAVAVPLFVEIPLWAAILWLAGMACSVWGLISLGSSLDIGLPSQQRVFVAHGAFRFSRHPIYLGLFIACLASLTAGWFVVPFALVGITLHHAIILAEERFLHRQHSKAYESYVKNVRRYL